MADEDKWRLVEVRAKALRDQLADRGDVTEKRMLGGLTFMVADHVCCGATSEDLVVSQFEIPSKQRSERRLFSGSCFFAPTAELGTRSPVQSFLTLS